MSASKELDLDLVRDYSLIFENMEGEAALMDGSNETSFDRFELDEIRLLAEIAEEIASPPVGCFTTA